MTVTGNGYFRQRTHVPPFVSLLSVKILCMVSFRLNCTNKKVDEKRSKTILNDPANKLIVCKKIKNLTKIWGKRQNNIAKCQNRINMTMK